MSLVVSAAAAAAGPGDSDGSVSVTASGAQMVKLHGTLFSGG